MTIRILSAGLLAALWSAPVAAQDATMKTCGEKWQAAKAAGATNGANWPKFLAECRAGRVSAPVAPNAVERPTASAPASRSVQAVREPVFPSAVSARHVELPPSQARRKTCSEQYQANKATDANGGLRWLDKGGYWSQCNRKLKG